MAVHVQRNFPPLETVKMTDRALMREVGLLARERIYTRTIKGTDMNGAPFAPYSAGYFNAKLRATGRAIPVNLQLSGGMLNAIAILDVAEDSVTIGFTR